jgi:sodium/potassium-transporting ATPase subunit alpha
MIPAISLAYESKESNIMKVPPRNMLKDRLVNAKLINFSYLQIGVTQACAGFYTYIVVLMNYGFPPAFLPYHAAWFLKGANTTTNLTTTPYPTLTYTNDAGVSDSAMLGQCAMRNYPSLSNLCWQVDFSGVDALQHAQCAFFIAIIVVQWADLVICKTRTLSMFQQGMRNGTLNFGLFFTTVLGTFLCYVPAMDKVFGTAPLAFVHWCPAMPFCILIFLYDEVRKGLIRSNPKGFVMKNTFY